MFLCNSIINCIRKVDKMPRPSGESSYFTDRGYKVLPVPSGIGNKCFERVKVFREKRKPRRKSSYVGAS